MYASHPSSLHHHITACTSHQSWGFSKVLFLSTEPDPFINRTSYREVRLLILHSLLLFNRCEGGGEGGGGGVNCLDESTGMN